MTGKNMRKFYIFAIVFLMVFLTSNSFAANELTENEADKYIDALVKKNLFSGSVLIAHNKKIILKKGYGKAIYEFDIDNNPNTKFRIGSLTKQFTAMSIMILAEKNQLNVNDKISKFLPEFPNGNKINIVHLLTHTSGIPDHTKLPDFIKERRVYQHELIYTINAFKDLPLEFSPGEKFRYSSSGYILLGYIIEKVSGISYQKFVKNNIFKPLKMVNSGFDETNKVIKFKANGYNLIDGKIVKAAYRNISNAHASGALYSTIEDLYLWDRALYTDSLISYDSLKKMFTPYTKHYGYGWGIVNIFGHKMVGHNGETEGYSSNISRFADADLCVIVLSNLETASVGKIAMDLTSMLLGKGKSKSGSKKVYAIDPAILKDYIGEYELKPNFIFTITEENSNLYCQATGQGKLMIHPESESVFFFKEVKAKISFIRDKNNLVEKLVLHQGGREIPAKKTK